MARRIGILEEGGFYDRDPRNYDLRVAVVFPGPYKESINSLGHQLIYFLANSVEGVMAERFTSDIPGSVESGSKLRDFDVVLASVHYEGQIHVLLRMLAREGILSPGSGDRPIVMAGGPALSNPLPASVFLDGVFLGDGERSVPAAIRTLAQGGSPSDLSGYGVYTGEGRVRFERSPMDFLPPRQLRAILPDGRRNPFLLEVSRGCSNGCRFCLMGWIQRPRRDRSWSELRSQVDLARELGYERIYLIGSDVLGNPRSLDLMSYILDRGLSFSLPSIRADRISQDLLEIIRMARIKSVSLAPETGSLNLAKSINKPVDPDIYISTASDLRNAGVRRIKAYFILGLPFESEEDVLESARLASKMSSPGNPIKVTISHFVPKPHTPFERLPMIPPGNYRERVRLFRSHYDGPINVMHPGRAAVQAALCLGDESIGKIAVSAASRPFSKYSYWKIARREGIDLDRLVYGERPAPWRDAVDVGVRAEFLEEEADRAVIGEITPSCDEYCSLCGACPLGFPERDGATRTSRPGP